MKFSEVVSQTLAWLQREGRVSYRALRLEFDLNEDVLDALKQEIIEVKEAAVDKDGKMLVWTGASVEQETGNRGNGESEKPLTPASDARRRTLDPRRETAERRQLTVLFCDLVDSTALSARLDPEEWREIVQAYQALGAHSIEPYEGRIAQYLGDGLLVYFGYPTAHEDDAQRAVRSGLAIVQAFHQAPLLQRHGVRVRIGIHTGLVVVGEIGGGAKREQLALGDTPNIAARLQGIASPNAVVMSDATQRLVTGLFDCDDLGQHPIKGLSTAVQIYQVRSESGVRSRLEVASRRGLTPLIGREHEVQLLLDRWEQAKTGAGQVVLLSGEPGIGKSRLVHRLKEQGTTEGAAWIEFRCAPFFQNTAFAPVIEHLQRLLQFAREDTPIIKLKKLQHTLSHYRFPQADTVPLLAVLLSLPHPEGVPPLTLSPQKQKQRTEEALVSWLVEEAERQAVVTVWEDLHWADPSTLELLTLLLDQVPTTRLLAALTSRPEFISPWGNRSHLSQITLSRLNRTQVREMVSHVTDQAIRASTGSARTDNLSPSDSDSVRPELVEGRGVLPDNLIDAVIARTDGVPLFVEELTKMVLETIREQATGSGEQEGKMVGTPAGLSSLHLGIPATLQDALMARLDRLGPAKEIAQLGATLGREFSYELIHAVSPLAEEPLQHGLKQLVEAELAYQRGLGPQAHYTFKHALIQDAAYQSLLKSTRQQYHRRIAQALEEHFIETAEPQPELLAHHYTEAGLREQAIPYWQSAGQRAVERSAHTEALRHLSKGLGLLRTLPSTPERDQHELTLQLALGTALQATKGLGAPETGATYARARELCQQMRETPRLFPVLFNLWLYTQARGEYMAAATLGRQLLGLAEQAQDTALFLEAHHATWTTAFSQGNFVLAREHLERGRAIYHPQKHHAHAFLYGGHDPGVCGRGQEAWVLWMLGYPDQALKRTQEALALAGELSHPMSQAIALNFAVNSHQFRWEPQVVREHADAVIALCSEQGFPFHLAWGTVMQGWTLAEQGHQEEGIAQMRQGLAAHRATGARLTQEYFLGLLAAVYREIGQPAEGLLVLAEALAVLGKNGKSMWEAELYRLAGELSLRIGAPESGRIGDTENEAENRREGFSFADSPFRRFSVSSPEECFLKAIEIARRQQAKSLELRAVMSLARLWQQQGKQEEAHNILSDIYNWFTEGFDTKDLQEAKGLLETLSH